MTKRGRLICRLLFSLHVMEKYAIPIRLASCSSQVTARKQFADVLTPLNNYELEMVVECPYCGSEDAYHDGVSYVCPDCDGRWQGDDDGDDDSW